jgi:hypothetical protein
MGEMLDYLLKEFKENPVKTAAATIVIFGSISGFIFFMIENTNHQDTQDSENNNIINQINKNKSVIMTTDMNSDDNRADNITEVIKSNLPPDVHGLRSDKRSPQIAGTTITWFADAQDPDNDQIIYRFFLNNKPVTEWGNDNSWTWVTSKDEVGDNNRIKVCVRDGKHSNLEDYDDCESDVFIMSLPADVSTKNQIEAQVGDSKHASQEIIGPNPVAGSSSTSNGFARDNEYVDNGVQPNCEPESEKAICTSSESCVDCVGKCWPPGNYDLGKTICSQGRWILTSYIRTNEYVNNGIDPECEPGSRQAQCSSPDSCVDCNGKCWSPGSYDSDSAKTACSQGKWTLPWANHIYK